MFSDMDMKPVELVWGGEKKDEVGCAHSDQGQVGPRSRLSIEAGPYKDQNQDTWN